MADGVNVNDGTGSKILTDEVTTVDGATVSARHAQQVKLGNGASGDYESVSDTNPLQVALYGDGGTGPVSIDSDRLQVKAVSDQLPSSLGVGGALNADLPNVTAAAPLEVRLYGAGGAAVSIDSDRLQVKATSDQLPSSLGVDGALKVIHNPLNTQVGLWNGTGADGARTTNFTSADQDNLYARGLFISLRTTANPGTSDSIKVRVSYRDAYNDSYTLWESATFTTNANRGFVLYPGIDNAFAGAGSTIVETESIVLHRKFFVQVIHSGSGSFTYNLAYTLIH